MTTGELLNVQTTTVDDSPPGRRLSTSLRLLARIAGYLTATVFFLLEIMLTRGGNEPAGRDISNISAELFALCGISLGLQAKTIQKIWLIHLAKLAAFAVIVQAALSLLGFAGLKLPEPHSVAQALNFLAIGAALVLFVEPPIGLHQRTIAKLHILAGLISLTTLTGYACTIANSLTFPPVQSLAFALLYLGVFFAQPDRGPFAIIVSEGLGGLVARRLFLTALGVPFGLVVFYLAYQGLGIYQPQLSWPFLIAAMIVLMSTLIVLNSASLERLDRQRLSAELSRRESERRLSIQYVLASILAESATLEEAAQKLLQTACQTMGWVTGALWLVDENAAQLRLYAFWNLPGMKLDAFEEATRQGKFERNVGLPGKAWAYGEALCLSTAIEDSGFTRGRIALKHGLHAGMAFPISVSGQAIAVLEFFSRETRRLDDNMLQLFATFGDQFGQFIQRKQAEEALKENQLFTRRIIEKAYDAFMAIDENGQITDWNSQAEATFGWKRAEAIGMPLSNLIAPPQAGQTQANPERLCTESGELLLNNRRELTAVNSDGVKFPAEMALIPVIQGERKTFCVFLHDITERKRSQELILKAIEDEKHIAQAIVEHSPLGIARLDQDLMIAETNSVLNSLLDPPSSPVGSNLFDLLPGLPRSPFLNTLRTGEPYTAENFKITLPGRPETDSYLDLAVWPIKDDKGRAKGIILLLLDATERVALVNQREDFVATLTHDLKAPLMGSNRTLQLLGEEAFGPLDQKEKDVIAKLIRSNEDLLAMIENLLEIYRYESGTEQFIFEKMEILPLVSNAIAGLSPIAQDKNIRMKSKFAKDLGMIEADSLALARVLTNLIMNAIKFTHAGGTITVAVERFNDNLLLSVEDTGIGIKPEEQKKIFQRYWRAESSLYKTGSGLGLYLCWQIVASHHGKIVCHSEPGKGTTFSITLPVAQPVKSRAATRLH
jgi:PAS domain S-box-containing protein